MTPVGEAWLRPFDAEVRLALPWLSTAARHLLDSHAALECGWGVASAWVRGFNFGNITAGPSWRGTKWTEHDADDEYAPDGSVKRVSQTWRAYSTVADAIADYWAFLGPDFNRGRYVRARSALEAADLPLFSVELFKAGYYTLPAFKYVARLGDVSRKVVATLAPPKESTP